MTGNFTIQLPELPGSLKHEYGAVGSVRVQLDVVFSVGRGGMAVVRAPEGLRIESSGGRGFFAVVELSSSSQAQSLIGEQVEFRSEGTPPTLALVRWAPSTPGEATSAMTPLEEVFNWRRNACQGNDTLEEQCFNRFDQQTLSEADGSHQWIALCPGNESEFSDRARHLRHLTTRLTKGLHARRLGSAPYPDASSKTAGGTSETEAALECVSQIFWDAFDPVLKSPPSNSGVARLGDAFQRFATGQLALLGLEAAVASLPQDSAQNAFAIREYAARACQPDSAQYALYAELADACVQYGVGPVERWNSLLPHLVRTIAFMRTAYGDRLRRGFVGLSPFTCRPQWSEERLRCWTCMREKFVQDAMCSRTRLDEAWRATLQQIFPK